MGRIKVIDRLALFFWVVCFFGSSSVYAESPTLLFIGNSYTYGNDLDQMTATLMQDAGPDWVNTASTRHAVGGAKFFQHLAQADGTDGDTALRTYLQGPAFFAVMLQEQSQIPGFPQENDLYTQSSAAFRGLDELVQTNGAHTMALMTWGRRAGDSQNAFRYPDFKTMQAHLKDGYFQYAIASSTQQRAVVVIPAGLAFEKIYDDIVAAGEDPLSDTSLFWQLYSGDGSHPSLHGTYLTACVIYASLTGEPLEDVLWSPEGIEAPVRDILQNAANYAVFDSQHGSGAPALRLPVEQTEEPQDPTDPQEPADPAEPDASEGGEDLEQDNSGENSGSASSTTEQPEPSPSPETPSSSGCSAFPHFALSALMTSLFFLRRRTRR